MSNKRTPEQTANLKRLAEVMATIAAPSFDGVVGLGVVQGYFENCGTYRCVIGWYNQLTHQNIRYFAREDLDHFGITDDQSSRLFSGYGHYERFINVSFPQDADYDPDATRREVTARRDYLVNEILGGDAR